MLNDLDETIKRILVGEVPLDTSEVDVVFDAPNSEWKASLARPTVNCYLYHLVENAELRRTDWEMTTPAPIRASTNGDRANNGARMASGPDYHVALRKRAPFRIDCSYMITAWANEPEDEHRLLWRALVALIPYTELPGLYLQGELAGQEWPMRVKVAQPSSIFKNPSDFWSSMEMPIKPAIDMTITLPLDPELLVKVPLVLTKRLKTYPITTAEHYESAVEIGGWVFAGEEGNGRDARRAPVAGVQVSLVERGLSMLTDEQGRFKFRGVPVGDYTLRATSASGVRVERTAQVPGGEYDIVLVQRQETRSK